jgi:hypothetical protein
MKDMNRRSALALGLAATAATPLLMLASPAFAKKEYAQMMARRFNRVLE